MQMMVLLFFNVKELAGIRREYSMASLDADSVSKDPIDQFEKWFSEALKANVLEPNAMNLATISATGKPSSRIVLLKGIDRQRLLFYTNYQSQKGRELSGNPACALAFFWPELERQVRISGYAERTSVTESDEYFKTRPHESQIGAWASPQSAVIASRDILEQRAIEMEKKFEGMPIVPRPQQWGGFAVTPFEFEFWQGRPGRLHDRILYTLEEKKWKVNRLAP
jgi:pyridoxamine 5'-phosphate oxidase